MTAGRERLLTAERRVPATLNRRGIRVCGHGPSAARKIGERRRSRATRAPFALIDPHAFVTVGHAPLSLSHPKGQSCPGDSYLP
jgi:hypothetical protein